MSKIYNAFLKKANLSTAYGKVSFDAEGVAEVNNKELEELLLGLPNYVKVEEEPKEEEPKKEEPKKANVKEEPKKEEPKKEEPKKKEATKKSTTKSEK